MTKNLYGGIRDMKVTTELKTWRYKDNGGLFVVDVVHWVDKRSLKMSPKPLEHHWNVYVYIYPDHPMFDKIEEEHTGSVSLPLHWGASYNRWTYDSSGSVICKKIGSDYQHIYDERFVGYSTEDEAWEVFKDAEELIQFMENREIISRGEIINREVVMACTCQQCGSQYKVDLIVSDELWDKIKPEGKKGGSGLLCGRCIAERIERLGKYNAYTLTKENT